MASHAHSPRAGAWAGVTAARGVAVETATSRCRGDITSYDLREARELLGSRGVRLRQSGVTFLIRRYHVAIITLTKQAN